MTSAARQRMARLPEPVQQAGAELGRLAQRARPYRAQIAIAMGSLLLVVVVARRYVS